MACHASHDQGKKPFRSLIHEHVKPQAYETNGIKGWSLIAAALSMKSSAPADVPGARVTEA